MEKKELQGQTSDPPREIGRYRITRELGRGGMGVVYLAEDPFIGRSVAVKTSLVSQSGGAVKPETFQKLFFNEARAAGKLTHPHIVSLYDAAMENDMSYLVMEYVDGHTLKKNCKS